MTTGHQPAHPHGGDEAHDDEKGGIRCKAGKHIEDADECQTERKHSFPSNHIGKGAEYECAKHHPDERITADCPTLCRTETKIIHHQRQSDTIKCDIKTIE